MLSAQGDSPSPSVLATLKLLDPISEDDEPGAPLLYDEDGFSHWDP